MRAEQLRDAHWFGWHHSNELDGQRPVVLVPTGAVEQHGRHLAVGTDIWVATEVAVAVARTRSRVLVGEPLSYGCSAHHRAFPGTVSLRVRTFIDLVVDVATCLSTDGFVPVFVNGHGGNRGPLQAAAQTVLENGGTMWALSYFDLIRDEALTEFEGAAMGHACALETSIMLRLHPAAVAALDGISPGATDRWPSVSLYQLAAADSVAHPLPFVELDSNGVVGDPTQATRLAGERLFSAAVARVGEAVDGILSQTAAEGEK